MSFIIPNATETTSGNRYASLDQAEPDALDFEILGERTNGVITGCAVTALTTPGNQVNVSAGYVLINGKAYPVLASAGLTLPTAPSSLRFDLIVARLSGSNVTIVTIEGVASTTNPLFPKSVTRTVGTPQVASTVNLTTDVVLAAIYRNGSTAITDAYIVDKRVVVRSNIQYQGSGQPSSDLGSESDLYYKTTLNPTNSSGVFVKRSTGWLELAKATTEPGVPIGALIMWPSSTANPDVNVWLEANGAPVSRVTYANLFAIIGTTYGAGDGSTTFNLPDFRNQYLMGRPDGGEMGTQVGNIGSAVTLTTANLPSHTHSLASSTTANSGQHLHDISHNHPPVVSSSSGGAHTHKVTGATEQAFDAREVANLQNLYGNSPGFGWVYSNLGGGLEPAIFTNYHQHNVDLTSAQASSNHTHTVNVSGFTGQTAQGGQHTHALTGDTGATGSAVQVNVRPSTYHIRYFIRHA